MAEVSEERHLLVILERLSALKDIAIPDGNLLDRTVISGGWSALINVVDRVLGIGKLVVLANLFSPSDFGLMGMALLTLAVIKQFSNLGLNKALIQKKEHNVDEYLDTTWILTAARGAMLSLVLFLGAPLAAQAFGEPPVTDIVRVIAVVPLIMGIKNPLSSTFPKISNSTSSSRIVSAEPR